MSTTVGPMTFDELSELYRVEMKSASITEPRKDLFRAMANLLTSLRQEYDRQMSVDPDSVMAEGAEQRRKKAERICKDVMVLRTRKIAAMAIRGAEGARNALDCLTDEEREYYEGMLDLTKRQLAEVDRLRGRRTTVPTRIDEPPKIEEKPVAPEPPARMDPAPAVADPVIPGEEMDAFDDNFEEPFDVPEEDQSAVPVETENHPEEIVAEPPADPVPPVEAGKEESDLSPVLIRVVEDLPEFAGPDRDYKLSKEDIVTLPKVLADVLMNTGKAVAIRPTP